MRAGWLPVPYKVALKKPLEQAMHVVVRTPVNADEDAVTQATHALLSAWLALDQVPSGQRTGASDCTGQ